MISMTDKYLVRVLLDAKNSVSARDDAAMDLHKYDNDLVVNALVKIASNEKEDPTILGSCGESLGTIWARKNNFDLEFYKNLSKKAKDGVFYVIKHEKPDWIKKFEMN